MWRVMASAPTGPWPMVSAPPGRFSTTTLVPSWRPSSGASRRATLSVALPAACGTTRRIGRSGYCAKATCATAAQMAIASNFMSGLQLRAHFAALVAVGVDVHVQHALLQILDLRGRELAARRHAVGVALLVERHDHRAVRALGAAMDVRHRALDVLGGDAA